MVGYPRGQVREWLELDLQDILAGGAGYDTPPPFSCRGAAAIKRLLTHHQVQHDGRLHVADLYLGVYRGIRKQRFAPRCLLSE
jgi:hypothetical protein